MSLLDYSLCRQTVTLYRCRDGAVKRKVLSPVLYEYGVRQVSDERGRRQETMCLLIVPEKADILPGDRVYDGVGPHINEKQWLHFLPVTVTGLSEINYVRPWFWNGQLCHIEAGRK